MKQKRQLFRKQIRRQALDGIFRQKRLEYFGYRYKEDVSQDKCQQDRGEQMMSEVETDIRDYAQAINNALINEECQQLYHSIKQSYQLMDKTYKKSLTNQYNIRHITTLWHTLHFPQLLITSVQLLHKINSHHYSTQRKGICKYAILHFYRVVCSGEQQQLAMIVKGIHLLDLYNFLFIVLDSVKFELEVLMKLLVVIGVLVEVRQVARDVFFVNRLKNNEGNLTQMITFEHLVGVVFANRDRFGSSQNENEQKVYRQMRLQLVMIFKQLGWEMTLIQAYLKAISYSNNNNNNSNNKQSNNNNNNSYSNNNNNYSNKNSNPVPPLDPILTQILSTYNNPSSSNLKLFFPKQHLSITLTTIQQLFRYYLTHIFQSNNQDNLTQVIQAYRLFIDHYSPNLKLIKKSIMDFTELVELLTMKEVNEQVKGSVLELIDVVIYYDEGDEVTNVMLEECNIVEKVVGCQLQQKKGVKLNILANIVLTDVGFNKINDIISQIVMDLLQQHNNNHITQTLLFISNYLTTSHYTPTNSHSFQLIIHLLQSLPPNNYTPHNILHQIHIYNHLYQNGFTQPPPVRYNEWSALNMHKMQHHNIKDNDQSWEISQLATKLVQIYEQKVGLKGMGE